MRKFFEQIHMKYPFIDPLINLLLGAVLGTFIGEFIDDLYRNWRFWENRSFWVCFFIFAVTILYFARYSSYSNSRKGRITLAKEILNETLIKIATKELEKSSSIDELVRNTKKIKPIIDTLDDVKDVD